MNHTESKLILEKIKKAKKILVNCHRNPDPDSLGSALAVYRVLKKIGKDVEVICPTKTPQSLSFLSGFEQIKSINFDEFDFSGYDLFITLDSSTWEMVRGKGTAQKPNIPFIVIDHHITNERYGDINLVDTELNSTAELVYLVFQDWGVEIDREIATAILCGIIGDTGVFRFPGTTKKTFEIAWNLMERGANKDKIILNYYSSYDFDQLKFWAEILQEMQFDTQHKFVWSAMPYGSYKKYGNLESARESAASMFAQIVKDTDFGMIMVEEEEKKLSISLRSRTDFDVSKIATALSGGGHHWAAGGKVEGLPFREAVNKALDIARTYAKENE